MVQGFWGCGEGEAGTVSNCSGVCRFLLYIWLYSKPLMDVFSRRNFFFGGLRGSVKLVLSPCLGFDIRSILLLLSTTTVNYNDTKYFFSTISLSYQVT